jgi:hypothetical protein
MLVYLFYDDLGGYLIVIIVLFRIFGITAILILRLPLVLFYVLFTSTPFPGLLLLLLFRRGLLLLLGHYLRFPASWILTLR